jgi:hypothetical protein
VTAIEDAQARLSGLTCTVERLEHSWAFIFEHVCTIVVSCPWRLRERGKVSLSDADDGQQYGLLNPVDAEKSANDIISGKQVNSFEFIEVSADLRIEFSHGIVCETFTNSIGYESWHADFRTGSPKVIVGMGGGSLTLF